MARFLFRLKTLLRVREATRDERRGQLAEAYRVDEQLAATRDALQQEAAGQKRRYGESLGGEIDVDQLVSMHRYELVLRAEIHATDEQRKTLAVEIERRRKALVAAETEVKVLEKLRETQHVRHRAGEALAEMKELDEVAGRTAGKEVAG